MLQHVDLEPVRTERPGELTAYYKIASRCSSIDMVFLRLVILSILILKMFLNSEHYKWALDALFIKHNLDRVIILEGLISVMIH